MGDKIVSLLFLTKIILSLTCSVKDGLLLYLQDNLAVMRDQGEYIETRSHDILTEALGKLEHPGRVRTKGISERCLRNH